MESLNSYREDLNKHLEGIVAKKEPTQLYEPIQYILDLGGKRLRPVLTLMTAEIFGGSRQQALDAALAVELFHNFSLIHDDIMDEAPLRRGQETVHEKWDLNTGILSGDAMLILAYQLFESYAPELFRELAKLFSKTALEVCEGQQFDVDFETRTDVTIEEYINMIDFKTAVLVGAAMKMGAMVAQASSSCIDGIYSFGRNLGIAFQLQDDYLDAFGNPQKFGKQVGGDIIANKKTYLYLKAIELADTSQKATLLEHFGHQPDDPTDKIKTVLHIFKSTGAARATQQEIERYTLKANKLLSTLKISEENKKRLEDFGSWLMNRST